VKVPSELEPSQRLNEIGVKLGVNVFVTSTLIHRIWVAPPVQLVS
jgi:hypothetical protein